MGYRKMDARIVVTYGALDMLPWRLMNVDERLGYAAVEQVVVGMIPIAVQGICSCLVTCWVSSAFSH
jgi:hypothetical protein